MEEKPKKLIIRLLEFAAMFALAMFLIRLGVAYLAQVWWILVILAVLTAGGFIAYRMWKNRGNW